MQRAKNLNIVPFFKRYLFRKKTLTTLFFLLYLAVVSFFLQSEVVPALTSETPLTLYSNQTANDLKKVTYETIKKAKTSITILIFSLTDSDIIALLKQKIEEGVDVTIVHDSVATPDLHFRLGPKAKVGKWRGRGLMHHKIIVIDHVDVWFGSTNLTRESLQLHANLTLGIHSPAFACECEKKALSMLKEKKLSIDPLTIQSQGQTIEFFFLPESKNALEKLISCIKSAKKSCKVAIYTFTHPALTQALVEAHRRGVNVQVVIDNESSRQTSKKAYVRLKREGVFVAKSKRAGLLHHKLAIIDDNQLITGSANWTKAAFQNNDDAIAFIAPLNEEQHKKINELWKTIIRESQFTSSSNSVITEGD